MAYLRGCTQMDEAAAYVEVVPLKQADGLSLFPFLRGHNPIDKFFRHGEGLGGPRMQTAAFLGET